MKQTWSLFMLGLSLVMLIGVFLRGPAAVSEDKPGLPTAPAVEGGSAGGEAKPKEAAGAPANASAAPEAAKKETPAAVTDAKHADPAGAEALVSQSAAEARVRRIDDPAISGLKTDVPLSGEMDQALKSKEQELADKERRLKELEERLSVEEARVNARIEEYQKLQDSLEGERSENKKRSEAVLAKLVKTFENMQPKKASGVITVMKDELAVELLLNMKEKKVATILDSMDANRAMTLSSLIAKRRPAAKAMGAEQPQPAAGPR